MTMSTPTSGTCFTHPIRADYMLALAHTTSLVCSSGPFPCTASSCQRGSRLRAKYHATQQGTWGGEARGGVEESRNRNKLGWRGKTTRGCLCAAKVSVQHSSASRRVTEEDRHVKICQSNRSLTGLAPSLTLSDSVAAEEAGHQYLRLNSEVPQGARAKTATVDILYIFSANKTVSCSCHVSRRC